jgi:hypothetical protein
MSHGLPPRKHFFRPSMARCCKLVPPLCVISKLPNRSVCRCLTSTRPSISRHLVEKSLPAVLSSKVVIQGGRASESDRSVQISPRSLWGSLLLYPRVPQSFQLGASVRMPKQKLFSNGPAGCELSGLRVADRPRSIRVGPRSLEAAKA